VKVCGEGKVVPNATPIFLCRVRYVKTLQVFGRGMSVSARATIPEAALNKVLNTTADAVIEYDQWGRRANQRGGSPPNYNFSNILSSSFAATGQDFGCVGESQTASMNIVRNPGPEGGIIISNHFSSMVIGTVGGGTGLPTQKACLDIVGCAGKGKVRKLAEIIAGYSLALDLSTISAVSVDEFTDAHARLGRNRPTEN
jgi:hydroxymethylglutaryl-CoA reductase (NADPH)